jgi:perosamine synthetase
LIRLASPDIRQEDIDRLVKVLQSGELVQGKAVEAFEESLIAFSGIPCCAVVSSGTAALHLALLALGIGPGDSVLVPAFTFPATANVVESIGASVILCDVDPDTYVATPELIEAVLSSPQGQNIRAIMLVHEFGYPARVEEIASLARKYGIKLIEDAACALGTVADNHHPGFFGDVACFSFHPRKAITTGEGGALLSRDADLIGHVKRLRNHGIQLCDGRLDFTDAGLNYRLTNFQAALGIGQLERFHAELDARHRLADIYRTELAEVHEIALPAYHPGHSWQSFMLVIMVPSGRDQVRARMLEGGVECNLGAQALNCLTYYRKKYDLSESSCPNATLLYRHGLVLPLYGKLNPEEIRFICAALKRALVR